MALPMPLVAPVMRTTLSLRRIGLGHGKRCLFFAKRLRNHRAALSGLAPAPLVSFIQSADGIEIKEFATRLHGRARVNGDAGRRIVAFEGMRIPLAAAT